MAVTLQQIAEAAGVSRGTVDRALNNRGRINAEVADKIRRIADEMGYQPNRAGRALAMAKRSITIGVLIQAADTPFMEKVIEGAEDAKAEVERLGAEVIIRRMEEFDAKKAVEAMHELRKAGCNGIALVPVDDERLKETVNESVDDNIPVITFNSDIEESKRLCFVGQDTWQSGRVAAGLMADILPADGKVLVISGYPTSYGHKNRTNGFLKEFAALREDIRVLDVQYDFDDDQMAEMITKGMLKEYEDLTGIYLAASGVEGVCRALEELGMEDKVKEQIEVMVEKELYDDCFYPIRHVKKKIRGEWKKLREKLLPGYVFITSDCVQELYRELRHIPVFTKLLGKEEEQIISLTECEVEWLERIKGASDQSMEVALSQVSVSEEDVITILSGPLKNIEGCIKKIDLHRRIAKVEVDFMNQKTVIHLGIEMVGKKE